MPTEKLEPHISILAAESAPWSVALSQSPDVILLDVSLPIVDGWDVARQLKAASGTKDIPIIALTAHAMDGDRKRSLEAGCDDYDTKPYKIERLTGKIELLLEPS